jgi:hypothetical protein
MRQILFKSTLQNHNDLNIYFNITLNEKQLYQNNSQRAIAHFAAFLARLIY